MAKLIQLSLDSSGNLVLTNGGNATRGTVVGRNISWEIADPRIESFKIVKKVPGDPFDPFEQDPNSDYGTKEHLQVKLLGPTGQWRYSIHWKDSATHSDHVYDPIITINPTLPFIDLISIISTAAAFLLISLLFWKKKKKKKKV